MNNTEYDEPDKPMASPLHIAETIRDQKLRAARERCDAKIKRAYRELEAEQHAARVEYNETTNAYLASLAARAVRRAA